MTRLLLAVGVFVLLLGSAKPAVSGSPIPGCFPCTDGPTASR